MNIKPINYKLVRQFSLNVNKYQSKNHYDCLEITPKATQGDVKAAYYKLSKQYHPDLNKGNIDAASKFRELTAAYETLGNVKARKLYDRRLTVGGFDDYTASTATGQGEESHDYQHASFYDHRNKPTHKKASTTTANYNIDEWTRAHYSQTFNKSWSKKQEEVKNIKTTIEEETETYKNVQTSLLLMLSIIVMALYGFREDYDKSTIKNQPDHEKPD